MSAPLPPAGATVIAGIGLRASAGVADLEALLARAPATVAAIATLAAKSDHPALAALIAKTGLPLVALAPSALDGIATPTRSPDQIRRFGTGSLAEACALVAAGPHSRLSSPRILCPQGRATIAFAFAERNSA